MYIWVTDCQSSRKSYIQHMAQNNRNHWVEGASADAGIREQLIAAAGEHFGTYGYEKTTLADLAKAIGFSKTYFYRFFRSKQEIGEAVCSQVLGTILQAIDAQIATAPSATEKLRRMLRTIPKMGTELFFQERKLHDVAATSAQEQWASSVHYWEKLSETLRSILQQGRDDGDFERKTPIDELTRAILMAMRPFIDPRVLQYHLDFVPDGSNEVLALVLRSLAP
jgi:AcrR family transcriptional regulator